MEVELVLNVIRILAILIGVVIAVYEIMNMGKTRKMEYLTRLSTHLTSVEFNRVWVEVLFQQHYSNYDEWREYYSPVVNPEAACAHAQLHTKSRIRECILSYKKRE